VNAVTDLRPKHVVDELVLGDAAQARKRARLDDRLKVLPVAGHLGARAGYAALDPLLQFIWINAHEQKRSGSGVRRYTE
jgi:hypothetical protein